MNIEYIIKNKMKELEKAIIIYYNIVRHRDQRYLVDKEYCSVKVGLYYIESFYEGYCQLKGNKDFLRFEFEH